MIQNKLLIVFGICLHVLGCVYFYHGFLPSNTQPNKTVKERKHVHNVAAKYTHLVVMVIDALRTDFVFGEGKWSSYMTFTRKKIVENKTYSYTARAKPPTVTMPRIKAFTSGSISGFNDIFLNIESPEFKEDNIVTQIYKSGKKILYFGDDTWVKLFPNHFERFDGTNSFFVSDYTEVDNNITRHIEKEFKQRDWNTVIMHYLGLDHIGHLAGPTSPLIGPKLIEMDRIIEIIFNKLVYRDNNFGTQSLFLICGDHGMSDAGSHGGSSLQEILTPAIFMDTNSGVHYSNQTIEQVDLASSLAVLFGLQVPQSSVGRPVPLLYNMYNKIEIDKIHRHYACQLYSIAETMISSTLLSRLRHVCHGDIDSAEDILELTTEYLQSLSPEYKIEYMIIGICLMICGCFIMFYVLLVIVPVAEIQDSSKGVWEGNFIISHRTERTKMVLNAYTKLWVCLFLVSMCSSSFIEEEQYIWYYFVTSSFVLLLLMNNDTNTMSIVLPLLLLLRVARVWNRTGVKWLNLKDLTDWFTNGHMNYFVTIYMMLSVSVYGMYMRNEKWLGRLMLTSSFLLLVVYRLSSSAVFGTLGQNYFLALYSSRLVYINVAIMVLLYQFSYVQNLRSIMIVLNMLLLRWNNVPWFCTIIHIELAVTQKYIKCFRKNIFASAWQIFWLFYSLSKFTYFSQGNSNSLTTVDISTGMIGFEEYHATLANLITFLATYGGQWFWFASFFDFLNSQRMESDTVLRISVLSTLYQSIEGTILCILVYIVRYHLFIWSVFTPRFLYMLASTFNLTMIALLYVVKTTIT